MSILQEYNKHEEYIGKKKVRAIDEYIKNNKHLSYEAIVYHKDEWERFEEWYNSKYGKGAKSNC